MLAISCRHIDVLASLLQVQSWKLRTKEVPVWTCDLLPLSPLFSFFPSLSSMYFDDLFSHRRVSSRSKNVHSE